VRPIVLELPVRASAEAAAISERAVEKLRARQSQPRRETERKLTALAIAHARRRLAELGFDDPTDDHQCLARYLNLR
jgi:hypothetical protein